MNFSAAHYTFDGKEKILVEKKDNYCLLTVSGNNMHMTIETDPKHLDAILKEINKQIEEKKA